MNDNNGLRSVASSRIFESRNRCSMPFAELRGRRLSASVRMDFPRELLTIKSNVVRAGNVFGSGGN